MTEYGIILLVFAFVFPLIPIVASVALRAFKIRPKNPNPIKSSIYECGMVPIGRCLASTTNRS